MMKRLLSLVSALSLSMTLWAAGAQVVEIPVTGMTCPFCVYGTQKKLSHLEGVASAEVSIKNHRARITMQPGRQADLMAIRRAIREAGFTPGEARVQPVSGQ